MVDDLQLLTGGAGVPVVVALVQILKPVLPDTRWHPLLAVVAGVLWAVAVAAVRGTPLGAAALLGVVVGLVASGAYSGAKAAAGR